MQEYGLQIASPTSTPPVGIDGTVAVAGDGQAITLRALQNLTQADVLLANLPRLYYRLLKTDSNTRTLANPQLRTAEGMPAQARFGERVPIPVTTFAPIATGGTPQQPITSFNYENMFHIDSAGTHPDYDVTLTLKSRAEHRGCGSAAPTFGPRDHT